MKFYYCGMSCRRLRFARSSAPKSRFGTRAFSRGGSRIRSYFLNKHLFHIRRTWLASHSLAREFAGGKLPSSGRRSFLRNLPTVCARQQRRRKRHLFRVGTPSSPVPPPYRMSRRASRTLDLEITKARALARVTRAFQREPADSAKPLRKHYYNFTSCDPDRISFVWLEVNARNFLSTDLFSIPASCDYRDVD